MSKTFVLDSSSLISISEKCFMKIIGELVKKKGWRFVIPAAVMSESVERPLSITRFELNALRIQLAVKAGFLEVVEPSVESLQFTKELANRANHAFEVDGHPLTIIQEGEAQAWALCRELGACVFVVDERTARLFVESPTTLEFIMRRKHPKAHSVRDALFAIQEEFPSLAVCRSTELMIMAFEEGLLDAELGDDRRALESTLYALKYSGCAVSETEIRAFLDGRFKT